MFDLTTRDIKYLQGVGPQRAAILNKELEIYSFKDLLYYFPYKYVDRSRVYLIREIDGRGAAAEAGRSFLRRYRCRGPGLVPRLEVHNRKV